MKTRFAESYSGEGFTAKLIVNKTSKAEGDFLVKIIDGKTVVYTKPDGKRGKRKVLGSAPNALPLPDTQVSEDKSTVRINVVGNLDGKNRTAKNTARTFAHEAGHIAGLYHTWSKKNPILDVSQFNPAVTRKTLKENLMNSKSQQSKVPTTKGSKLTESQLKSINRLIQHQQ